MGLNRPASGSERLAHLTGGEGAGGRAGSSVHTRARTRSRNLQPRLQSRISRRIEGMSQVGKGLVTKSFNEINGSQSHKVTAGLRAYARARACAHTRNVL
jgi:hypothetical protein